jgi:glycosyltransferase involved in cell wall biosynthesis
MTRIDRLILLYADVDLNVIDGSSVWLVSMAEALSRTSSRVDVLLKAPVQNGRLSDRLHHLDGVRVRTAASARSSGRRSDGVPLTPERAVLRMKELDAENRYDVVVCRGLTVCRAVAVDGAFEGRLWPYMTEVPQRSADLSNDVRRGLEQVAGAARRIFAQTEDARAFLEHHVPIAAGKVVLLPPMIPAGLAARDDRDRDEEAPLRLVYAGKLAAAWRTREMCDLPRRARERGFAVELTVIGDKVHREPGLPGWSARMREALATAEGVTWLGGLSREDAIREVSKHDIGMSWRSPALDASHELSTKVLEYAAAGVAPALNATAAHRDLLGRDYPLFVDDTTILDVLERVFRERALLARAREVAAAAAAQYTIPQAAQRLESTFARSDRASTTVRQPVKVLVASHDLKFAGELVDHLQRHAGVRLTIDHWRTLHEHDVARSEELLADADVVLCEWAGPNAVWYSKAKRPGQRLVVRLHMFELGGPWLPQIDVEAIDRLVCVSDLYAERSAAALGMDAERIVVIPNTVDCLDLDRTKLSGAEYHLGLVGVVPVRKRLDRALDLLAALRSIDDRFTLHIRGRLPNEYPWEWRKPVIRGYYQQQFARIETEPALRGGVVLEPFGADVGSWLRRIGWVLSPSTEESFHLAPVEGMASGAVPVLWVRPGAAGIFGERWMHAHSHDAATWIAEVAAAGRWNEESAAAKDWARRYDTSRVMATWNTVLGLE